MNIFDWQKRKIQKEKITVVTCYDYTTARILDSSNVDALLVGDSLAMVMYGHNSTLKATTEIMALHIDAVVRGAPSKFVIGDMPFLSYRKDLRFNMDCVEKLMQAGCQALKLEGALGNEALVEHIVQSGVPVMGHIGLTPQSIHQLGGFKVQGREEKAAKRLLDEAKKLEQAGSFAIVLECVPSDLARAISAELTIPTIGIGAGADTDGQVLVITDMLGMNTEFKPKFLRHFTNGAEQVRQAVNQYATEVKSGGFPNAQESYE
jgi:3-methyl-2-oxobutanoate hydroxymethyltransferase